MRAYADCLEATSTPQAPWYVVPADDKPNARLIVSQVVLEPGDELRAIVEHADGTKCERCWRFVPSVRSEPEWAGICDRCVEALAEPVNS